MNSSDLTHSTNSEVVGHHAANQKRLLPIKKLAIVSNQNGKMNVPMIN